MRKNIFLILSIIFLTGCGSQIELVENSDSDDWQTYRNGELGFELKYPGNWYWEDYSDKYHYPTLGFYEEGHEKGWEYNGDIMVKKIQNEKSGNFESYLRNIFDENDPYLSGLYDSRLETKNKDDRDVIFISNVGGNINADKAYISCDGFIILMEAPFGIEMETLRQMANEVLCLS